MNILLHSSRLRMTVMAAAVGVSSLAGAQTVPAAAAPAAAASAPSLAPPALPASPTVQPIPAARWTPAAIRQSFDLADANSDGVLTRAEAQRLAIMPHSFEDMDENKDGVVDRAEYESSLSR